MNRRAAAVAFLVMLALGVGAGAPAQAAGGAKDARGALAQLAAEPCPEQPPMELPEPTRRELRAAKRFRFSLVSLPATKLRPPIAWRQANPHRSRPWQRRLNTLMWLDPLIASYVARGDRRALAIARRIALDWIARHPAPRPRPSGLAWEDKRAGDRVLRIGYIARLSACAGALNRRQARRLLAAVEQHAGFLVASSTPPDRTNHQSARDLSLFLLGGLFPFLPDAEEWRALGARRFEDGIAGLVHGPTAIQLEQSPAYQVMVERMLADYLRHHPDPPDELRILRERMRYATWWLAMPNGRLWPTGDTRYGYVAPGYAATPASRARLAPTLPAGFGIVKGPDSYFATTAAFHRRSHKQIDDLGFELFGRGKPVITDSGRAGVAPESAGAGRYPGSARAHSTVTLGARWRSPRLDEPYGAALTAQGERDGWFAVEGRNIALVRAGIDHRRLFLYRPGELLVIRDRIEAASPRRFSRWLQIAPGLKPDRDGRVVRLRDRRGTRATIWDRRRPGILPPALHSGERKPLRGWYVAPVRGGKLRPRWALELPARAQRGAFLTTIAFGRKAVTGRTLGADALELCMPGGDIATIAVAREGRRLDLDVERRADNYAECP